MPLNIVKPFPRRARLSKEEYLAVRRYFITINCFGKRNVFVDIKAKALSYSIRPKGLSYIGPKGLSLGYNDTVFKMCVKLLRECSEECGFLIWVFIFMPTHMHMLIQGSNEKSDLQKFIKLFKQKTGYAYKKSFGNRLWATSYYDRVLRKEEATKDVILYILNNPVRKGLVEDWGEYPFIGSFVVELKNLI